MTVSAITPFVFEDDFASGSPLPAPEKDRAGTAAAGGMSVDQPDSVREAWQTGHDAGIEAGHANAMATIEKRAEELLAKLHASLAQHIDESQRARALALSDIGRLAMAIAKPLTGEMLGAEPAQPVLDLVSTCLDRLYGEESITVTVAPELREPIQARLQETVPPGANLPTIEVCEDPALQGSDCRIEWQGGAAERTESDIWHSIEAIIEDCDMSALVVQAISPTRVVPPANCPDGLVIKRDDIPNSETRSEASADAASSPLEEVTASDADAPDDASTTLAHVLGPEIEQANQERDQTTTATLDGEAAWTETNDGKERPMSETDLDLEQIEASTDLAAPDSSPDSGGAVRTAADLESVYDIPVQVSAVLGKASMQVNQLLRLGRGAVVELDRKVGEAVDIYVNNRLVARGEVVVVEERLGVTMTEIIKSDRS